MRSPQKKIEAHDALFRVEPLAATRNEAPAIQVFPSPLTGGPWNPAHQHGGPVAGLLSWGLDRIESPAPMRLARITVEMFRGVPLTPLRLETKIVRGGRRIQGVEATLFDDDRAVARATGLRIRSDETLAELSADGPFDDALGKPPDPVPEMKFTTEVPFVPGFIRAVDLVNQPPEACGEPASVWTRLRCRVIEGEDPSPTVRLASLVDFASGTGNVMDYGRYTSINPDLTIHVLRPPRTEWIGLRGVTLRAADGIGQSTAAIFDELGPIAQVQASLLLDRRSA